MHSCLNQSSIQSNISQHVLSSRVRFGTIDFVDAMPLQQDLLLMAQDKRVYLIDKRGQFPQPELWDRLFYRPS